MKRREFLHAAIGTAGIGLLIGNAAEALVQTVSSPEPTLPSKSRRVLCIQCTIPIVRYPDFEHLLAKNACVYTDLSEGKERTMLRIGEIPWNDDPSPRICVPIIKVINYADRTHPFAVEVESEQITDRVFQFFAEHHEQMGEFGKAVWLCEECGYRVRNASLNPVTGKWQESVNIASCPFYRLP